MDRRIGTIYTSLSLGKTVRVEKFLHSAQLEMAAFPRVLADEISSPLSPPTLVTMNHFSEVIRIYRYSERIEALQDVVVHHLYLQYRGVVLKFPILFVCWFDSNELKFGQHWKLGISLERPIFLASWLFLSQKAVVSQSLSLISWGGYMM